MTRRKLLQGLTPIPIPPPPPPKEYIHWAEGRQYGSLGFYFVETGIRVYFFAAKNFRDRRGWWVIKAAKESHTPLRILEERYLGDWKTCYRIVKLSLKSLKDTFPTMDIFRYPRPDPMKGKKNAGGNKQS